MSRVAEPAVEFVGARGSAAMDDEAVDSSLDVKAEVLVQGTVSTQPGRCGR